MPKRLLVLADIYPPHFAPRAFSLVRYWVNEGWEVAVATEEIVQWNATGHGKIFEGMEDPCPTYRIPLRRRYDRWESLGEVLFSLKEKHFFRAVESFIDCTRIDLIVSFSYRTFPHGTAALLARKYHIPVVMDSRDIIEQYPRYEFLPTLRGGGSWIKRSLLALLRRRYIKQRNVCFQWADRLVTVSPWHQQVLQRASQGVPVSLFYNGYDQTLFFAKRGLKNPRFTITFTGRLLTLTRSNPTPLFQALNSPELCPILSEGLLEVAWYVDAHSRKLLEEVLRSYPPEILALQRIRNMIPFRQVPDLLHQSAMVLLLASPEEEEGAHGIVSTKIFEALAVEKPVLMVMSDEAIGESLLQTARSGCPAHSIPEIIDYICRCYEQWKSLGHTETVDPNREYIATFARDEVARHYTAMLEEVLHPCQNIE